MENTYFSAKQIYTTGTSGVATSYIEVNCWTGTTWSCSVNGNFGLNKYEGSGPTNSLKVEYFDDDDRTAFGEVTFHYIQNQCLKHLTIPIFYAESDNWLNIFPTEDVYSKSLVNEYKVFNLKSNLLPENIDVYLPSDDNYKYFITKNYKLYLIKTNSINTKITLHASTSSSKGAITVLEENLTT